MSDHDYFTPDRNLHNENDQHQVNGKSDLLSPKIYRNKSRSQKLLEPSPIDWEDITTAKKVNI